MSSYSTSVNGKQLDFTDSSVLYDGTLYDFIKIENVKHRGGNAPAFVFDYEGVQHEIPYNPDDKAVIFSYFKKAAAMTSPPETVEDNLTSLDEMGESESLEFAPEKMGEPNIVEGESIEGDYPIDNNPSSTGYRSYNGPNYGSAPINNGEKKFYQKTWFIILLLIIFWPVGVFLMWKYAGWKKPVKIIISALIAICLIFAFIPSSNDDGTDDTSYEATEETTTEETTTEPTTTEPTTETPKKFDADDYESIPYEKLARNPEDYEYTAITGSGEVVQVIEGDDEVQLRVAVDDDYDNIIFLAYDPEIMDSRVLENDHIKYYGTSMGTITYESTLGGNITIPSCICDKIEIQ